MTIGPQSPDPILLLFAFALLVVVFLALRELVCWYWKLNKIVALLKEIADNTAPKQPPAQPSPPTS